MTLPVVITGATGFVGSAVSRHATTRTHPVARRGRSDGDRPVLAMDVTDRRAVREALRGAGSVIHCVSYVGSNPDHAWHVNDEGTAILVEVAAALGIENLVYVSTAGVYGGGAQRNTYELAPTSPTSEASRSRLSAERRIVAAGGTVIRPHLTYGVGDRWFIPRLRTAASILGGVPRGVKVSTISVDDLAQQIWVLHDYARRRGHSGVHNAHHNVPTTLGVILRESCPTDAERKSVREIHPERAQNVLVSSGLSRHQAEMLTQENTFSSNLPTILPCLSTPRQFRLSRTDAAWYQEQQRIPSKE